MSLVIIGVVVLVVAGVAYFLLKKKKNSTVSTVKTDIQNFANVISSDASSGLKKVETGVNDLTKKL